MKSYLPHENRKIERRVRKRHQQISRVRNLEKTKDGTNKTCQKGLTSAKAILGGEGGGGGRSQRLCFS